MDVSNSRCHHKISHGAHQHRVQWTSSGSWGLKYMITRMPQPSLIGRAWLGGWTTENTYQCHVMGSYVGFVIDFILVMYFWSS